MPYEGPPIFVSNHKSALQHGHRDLVEQQIKEELAHDRYIIVPKPARITSALGAIPKDNGKIRLIHDCSRPHGEAVNDLAAKERFSYATTAAAMAMMTQNCYLAKVDLSGAYRSVGIHPDDYQVAGLAWTFSGHTSETYLTDTCLMFGARLAPFTFHTLTSAVCRIMETNGHPGVVAYLDDFLVVALDFEQCLGTMNTLLSLLRLLGFSINYSKVLGPCQRLTFLGIDFDTVSFVASLPLLKLQELLSLISATLQRASVTKHQLQKLAGKMVWASRLIIMGRAHLRRLFNLMNVLDHPSQRTKLTEDAYRDLTWWLEFSYYLNGTFPIIDTRPCSPLCIDACSTGGGGFFQGQGFFIAWDDWPGTEDLHINFKEVLVLEPAAHLWAPLWANSVIYVHSDNQCAVGIINKGNSKNETVMTSLQRISWLAARWNFSVKAVYYPGERNLIADALSRLPALPAINTLNTMLGHCFLKSCVPWHSPEKF